MSSYKRATVVISQEEYRRLHDADMQRRVQKKKEKRKRAERGSVQLAALKSAYSQVESRQDHYEQMLGNLREEIRSIEWQAAQDLINSQATFYEAVINEMQESAEEREVSLEARMNSLGEELQRERASYQQNIQDCISRIDEWSDREEYRRALVDSWIAQAGALHDFIIQEYDTNHFVPDRLEKIAQRLDLARMNLEDDMPESALQVAQMAYLELSDLRVELERLTLEWQNLFAYTCGAVLELKIDLESNAQIPALDAEGNELPILIDVDLWSDQKYQALLTECRELNRKLTQQTQEIQMEEFQRISANDIPRIRHELDVVIYEARLHVIQAQIRANLAELAVQALRQQGFTLVEAAYEGSSIDAPYGLRLHNRADGISVKIRVVPKRDQDYANDIVVVSEDSTVKSEQEMQARFNGIRAAFAKYGMAVGPTQTMPDESLMPASTVPPDAESQIRPESERLEDVRAD